MQAREWYREDLVGQAIADSGVRRDTLFLTSKLHPRDLAQAQHCPQYTCHHKPDWLLMTESVRHPFASHEWSALSRSGCCLQASSKFSDSLRDLNTTYLDLFLLHYPRSPAPNNYFLLSMLTFIRNQALRISGRRSALPGSTNFLIQSRNVGKVPAQHLVTLQHYHCD
jgi:aryl-alcohol dehydrogenase-like predicted oxidoreductase